MPIAPQSAEAIRVFCSYAHEDEDLRKRIETHLGFLKRESKIEHWHDGEIKAGEEWRGKIDAQLNSADVILLLISAYFVDSDFCYSIEMQRAMERHDAGEAIVIPILLHPCDWQRAPFGKLQALPKGKAISLWPNTEEALSEVAKGVREVVEGLITARAASQTPPTVTEEARRPPTYYIPDYLIVDFVPRHNIDGNNIVESLKSELAPHRKRLIALWGAGGVGKTAIAAEVARALAEVFKQRVVWVSADGRDDFSLITLLDGVATQLGHDELRKLALEPKREQVRDIVINAPTLIVLDNFETIEPEEGKLCATWLAQSGLCSALITTREKIERALNISIDPMLSEESQILLRQLIAQRVHDPKAFKNLDNERVIQTAEFNPLVLQWIVGQIDLAQGAEEVLNDLKHGEGTAAERVFNRSFDLPQLNNGGRAVLLALSLFVPSASRKALAEVAGFGKEKDKKRFRDAVKTLSSLWLLRTAQVEERLAVEGLTRELAKARLDHDPRAKTILPRYIARFLHHVEVNSKPTPESLNLIEIEKDNILNAIDVAFELSDQKSAIRIRSQIEEFLSLRGYWDEAIRTGEKALRAARDLALSSWIGGLTNDIANVHYRRGDLTEARRLCKESLEIQKKLGDQRGIASLLHNLGLLARDQGDVEEARRLFKESLEIHKKLGDQRGIPSSLHNLGLLAQDQGDVEEARRLYNESLEIEKKLGNQSGIATSLHNLGTLNLAEGDLPEAAKCLNQSLGIFQSLKYKQNIAECLESIGALRVAQKSFIEARTLYDEALQIAQALGSKFRIASVKRSLGLLAEKENDSVRAVQLLGEAISMFDELGSPKAEEARKDLERVEGESL